VKTRVNVLACVDRLLDCLDKMSIIDDVLPFLADIHTDNVQLVMPLVGQQHSPDQPAFLSLIPSHLN